MKNILFTLALLISFNSFGQTAKEELGDLNGACADWKEAARLGNTLAAEWVADQCN